MLDLSRCTLLFVETRAHEITRRVINDCLTKAKFGDVLVYTDAKDKIGVDGVRYIPCDDFSNKRLAGQFYYAQAMLGVQTDFALMLEWDAGIFDASKWRPEFFNYDYIGAPWPRLPHAPQYNVGNGGFTLMSQSFGRFIVDNFKRHSVYTDFDVCRTWRGQYEAAGFKWPDFELASAFAWELGTRNPEHFGYHGAFNWPTVLPHDEIVARAKLMLKSDYLITKSRQLFNAAPWLLGELTPDEVKIYTDHTPPGYVLRPRLPGMMSAQQRAAMQLMQAQRRGLITAAQQRGLKA